ncbi:hypothetical protein T02_14626 [Trichinella nativa]|uniref:Integrase zinc-binding domain-containing protein n=1 Tax=Trichinella nativa TaxID=6335 RepID=A0A0V1KK28_9BILA|nr:hypothetical protein T02_14626 [Trichinella nativa]
MLALVGAVKQFYPYFVRTQVHAGTDHNSLAHNLRKGEVAKSLEKIRQRFYWPQQREHAEDWCRFVTPMPLRKRIR